MNHRLEKLKRNLTNACIDFGGVEDTVLLVGSGRSGTTWVQEIINYDNAYRFMFEPFYKLWALNPYLRPTANNQRYTLPIDRILCGNIKSPWIDRYNRKFIARKRLIKSIRAHHFLKYIRVNYPTIPVVFILRHPCAVAASRLTLGWGTHANSRLNDYLLQTDLVADHLSAFRDLIENTHTIFETHILTWCIQNYVALRMLAPGDVHVLFYEQCCTAPTQCGRDLFTYLKKPLTRQALSAMGIPSAQAKRQSAIRTGGDLLRGWQYKLTEKQIQRAEDILQDFGLDRIYTSEIMPQVSADQVLELF